MKRNTLVSLFLLFAVVIAPPLGCGADTPPIDAPQLEGVTKVGVIVEDVDKEVAGEVNIAAIQRGVEAQLRRAGIPVAGKEGAASDLDISLMLIKDTPNHRYLCEATVELFDDAADPEQPSRTWLAWLWHRANYGYIGRPSGANAYIKLAVDDFIAGYNAAHGKGGVASSGSLPLPISPKQTHTQRLQATTPGHP